MYKTKGLIVLLFAIVAIMGLLAGRIEEPVYSYLKFSLSGGIGDPAKNVYWIRSDNGWTFKGFLIPAVDSLYDIGSASKRIQDIYTKRLTASGGLFLSGANPIVFDGATSDAYTLTFAITNPTAPSKIATFRDKSGTVAYLSDIGDTALVLRALGDSTFRRVLDTVAIMIEASKYTIDTMGINTIYGARTDTLIIPGADTMTCIFVQPKTSIDYIIPAFCKTGKCYVVNGGSNTIPYYWHIFKK